MANEVNNQTEESAQAETSASTQTNTNDSTATESNTQNASAQTATVTNSATPAPQSDAQNDTAQAATDAPGAAETHASQEEDFGSILEKFEQEQTTYQAGDLVEGKVVGVSERGVLIDFGYKSEGIAPIEDFTSPTGETTVERGDTVEVIIKSIYSGDAPPVLSRADAKSRKSWDVIEKAFNEEQPITGRVVEVTKGGLRIDIEGVEAFLPGSQVDSRPIRNLNSFVGQDIEAKIIKFSRKRNNIVLSRKVLTDEVVNKQKGETLGNIEEGYVVEGTVKNLTEYGAFVDIGGIDGLLHVTDMSWGRLQNPAEHFKVNDQIQVKVLKLDRQKEKVALGYKQLIADPWSTVMELYPINSKLKGRVSSVTDYGAFVELEPGVEGLVHVSEMSWSKRSQSPKKLLRAGDEVEVQVLGIDTEDRRISLGIKQLQANPWQTIRERYRVGQTVTGKVRNLTDFGAFIEIEDGVDGLVHVSDITWSKKVKHPKDVLKRDQEVSAVIKNIDTENRRMSLSIKELTPSAWDSFVASHKPGDIVRGKLSRFTGFGVFVELGNDLEGLCHISELSDERVERPEDIGSIGQEMDFKILRIENDVQKIGLSHRAVGKDEEPAVDTKNYSTEAKSGMASLGELMNLKRGGAEETGKEEQPRLSKKERRALQAQERAEQELVAAAEAAKAADRTAEPIAETESSATSAETESTSGENQTAPTDSAAVSEETAAVNEETTPVNKESAAVSKESDTVNEETSAAAKEETTSMNANDSASQSEATAPTATAATDNETPVESASESVATAAPETSSAETAAPTESEMTDNTETNSNDENNASEDSAPTNQMASEATNEGSNEAKSESDNADAEKESDEKTANG